VEALIRQLFHAGSMPRVALGYAGAGAVGTAVHYLLFLILLQVLVGQVILASTLGAIVGGVTNYYLAHNKVFKSDLQHLVALPRFALVALVGIGINALVLSVVVTAAGPFVGQIVASTVVLVFGFTLNRTWSFRG
jgi:putative flippase GtrA